MEISKLAGKPADPSLLINVPRLVTAYYTGQPGPSVPTQRVVFGTSGDRGSALDNGFNEAHILAMTQAICPYRRSRTLTDRSTSASIRRAFGARFGRALEGAAAMAST